MTNEEAQKMLTEIRHYLTAGNPVWDVDKVGEAMTMAIKALKVKASEITTGSDLISRQDAIRWVKTECNPYGKPTLDFESGKRVIEHLEQMPFAGSRTEGVLCALADRACPFQGKEYVWCLTCPHISEEDRALVKMAIEPRTGECKTCKRNVDNGGFYDDGRTRCPIQEHYALPNDGYCHLYEPRMRGEEE